MLTFDSAAHRYYWHGQPVPNVTRIIAPLTDYSRIPPEVLQRAQEQGKAIHKMVELDCRGRLDTDNLPEWMRPRYRAWCNFKAQTGFICWDSERMGYCEAFGYGYTLDLAGRMPLLKNVKGGALIDIKRSLYGGAAIGLQLAAYEEARNREVEKDLRTVHRFALLLNDNESYRLEPFTDRDDYLAFFACLQQLRWREKHYGKRS